MSHVAGSDQLRVYYVQPAVNCQPSYCWGISEIEPHTQKVSNPRKVISRCAWNIKLGGRKCMYGDAALHVARYHHST